ncbi:MAG: hypothetical protein PHX13_12585, partial [Thiovulaceae bacterium]|nr:hypothetical protein [Sulfurimonadaceae bacterium]
AEQKLIFQAAGEALLVKGVHGGGAVFIGFFIPTLANMLFAFAMRKGKVFGKITVISGIAGNILMLLYLIVITFIPEAGQFAIVLAMPGGVLIMIWMILFTARLFKICNRINHTD